MVSQRYDRSPGLKNRRVVFHIKGNAYRLVVAITDRLQIVPVKSSADRIVCAKCGAASAR